MLLSKALGSATSRASLELSNAVTKLSKFFFKEIPLDGGFEDDEDVIEEEKENG